MPEDINSILRISNNSAESPRPPSPKGQYIKRIRGQSAYPVFRSFLRLSQLFIYGISGLLMLGGLIAGLLTGGWPGIILAAIYFIAGLVLAIFGRVSIEASTMLADIADSITDLNYRYETSDQ